MSWVCWCSDLNESFTSSLTSVVGKYLLNLQTAFVRVWRGVLKIFGPDNECLQNPQWTIICMDLRVTEVPKVPLTAWCRFRRTRWRKWSRNSLRTYGEMAAVSCLISLSSYLLFIHWRRYLPADRQETTLKDSALDTGSFTMSWLCIVAAALMLICRNQRRIRGTSDWCSTTLTSFLLSPIFRIVLFIQNIWLVAKVTSCLKWTFSGASVRTPRAERSSDQSTSLVFHKDVTFTVKPASGLFQLTRTVHCGQLLLTSHDRPPK